jgi:hypothetical protein
MNPVLDNEREHVRKMVHLVAYHTWSSHPFIYGHGYIENVSRFSVIGECLRGIRQ